MRIRIPSIALILFAAAASGCGQEPRFVGDCKVDSDCPVGSFCKRDARDSTGLCSCRSDEACGDGEFCNVQGRCQRVTGCRSNGDCADPASFCDLSSGDCVPRTGCGFDVHCPAGTVCDESGARCVNGCRDSGDCPLYAVCDRTGLAPGATLGACVSGICEDDDYCPYGQECSGRQCVPAVSRDHCADCSDGRTCGEASSFCLVNSAYDPAMPGRELAQFCGVDCSDDPSVCPSGYGCGAVVLLTQDQCTEDAACGGGGRRCAIGEGDLRGFCTCVQDADCRFEAIPARCTRTCSGLGVQPCESDADCLGRCIGTCGNGQRCSSDDQCAPVPLCQSGRCVTNPITACRTAEDCLCDAGRCINTGRPCTRGADCNPPCQNGGCYLGDACAPEEGLTCADVAP